MLKLQLLALRALWRVWNGFWLSSNALADVAWPWRVRCDGYAQIGADRAQYCYRFAAHKGPCLAKISADHESRAAEFMPDLRAGIDYTGPYATCRHCYASIHLLKSPTGSWWAHNAHPADGHDGEAENWRTCPHCGEYTRISHRSRFCRVDGMSTPEPHWCCGTAGCDAPAVRLQGEEDERQLRALDALLDRPEPVLCRCQFMNNPPCSNCEAGLVDPDGAR